MLVYRQSTTILVTLSGIIEQLGLIRFTFTFHRTTGRGSKGYWQKARKRARATPPRLPLPTKNEQPLRISQRMFLSTLSFLKKNYFEGSRF